MIANLLLFLKLTQISQSLIYCSIVRSFVRWPNLRLFKWLSSQPNEDKTVCHFGGDSSKASAKGFLRHSLSSFCKQTLSRNGVALSRANLARSSQATFRAQSRRTELFLLLLRASLAKLSTRKRESQQEDQKNWQSKGRVLRIAQINLAKMFAGFAACQCN